MANRTFILLLVVAAVLLAGLVYLHIPRSGSQAATAPMSLHGR